MQAPVVRHVIGSGGGSVTDEDSIEFDLEEWYLRREGIPWGPVCLEGLRDLVRVSAARGSSLVRREGESDWVRLESVLPDWSRFEPEEPYEEDPDEPEEVTVSTYGFRTPVLAAEEIALSVAAYATVFALLHAFDLWAVSIAVLGTIVGALAGTRSARVEVTNRAVYLVSRGSRRAEMPLADIDRAHGAPEGFLSWLTGRRIIHSRLGGRLRLNRRALRDEDYQSLMHQLRLDP
jgi:hypothetical protein